MERYARRCDATNKGMNDGWCWGDGVFYTATLEATMTELRSDISDGAYDFDEVGAEVLLAMSDDDLLTYAHEHDVLYWTEWYEEEDIDDQGYYYTEDGEEVEL